VGAPEQQKYLKIFYQYGPLWNLLETRPVRKVRKGNYTRIFDQARRKVRAWEQSHLNIARPQGVDAAVALIVTANERGGHEVHKTIVY
jgi:hypothetical protein